ncbi:hypothetical protein [Neptuniibacter sp. QD37_11]|uniref:hypothetical protein n=1 Tax=Neptuniibacter sp. QD37_11 TaxID=3398209 RepID=UPI0039F508BB
MSNPESQPTMSPYIDAPYYAGPYKCDCDLKWRAGLDRKFDDAASRYPRLIELKEKLQSIAGGMLSAQYEEDLDKILTRGFVIDGDNSGLMLGEPSQCHMNSANLWDANRDKVRIATGYALSEDGQWCQHSWCVCPMYDDVNIEDLDINSSEGWQAIETTEERLVYFGFVMTEEEAEAFLFSNY